MLDAWGWCTGMTQRDGVGREEGSGWAQEPWSGWPIPSPGDLPDPGMEPVSPALKADSLPAELPGKP